VSGYWTRCRKPAIFYRWVWYEVESKNGSQASLFLIAGAPSSTMIEEILD
jgi:hypothetical protein